MGKRRRKKGSGSRDQVSKTLTPDPYSLKPHLVGNDEASFVEVYELTLELHREGGYAPLDNDKAAAAVYQVLTEGMVWVARDAAGVAIGTIGLTELKFWYSQESYLQDAWLYVRPAFRKGRVGVLLMQAARAEAQKRNKIALITVTSPDRRPKATPMTLDSQIAGYVPLGYTLRLR